jgi:regulator of replication initiation timing
MIDINSLMEQWHALHQQVLALVEQNNSLIQVCHKRQTENAQLQTEISRLRKLTASVTDVTNKELAAANIKMGPTAV